MGKTEQLGQSSCPSWDLLLRHVVQAERLTWQQQELVVEHIGRCERCANMYEALSDANEELWEDAARAAGIPVRSPVATRAPEEGFAETWRRIEADEAARRQKSRRARVFRIGSIAAAACLLIAIGVGWMMLRNGGSGSSDRAIATNPGGLPFAFAERVTNQGRTPLAMNQPVTTGAEPQEILLGGMHRVVMNRGAKATFTAAAARSDGNHAGTIPYEIQLARGELYVEVVPGNSFTVKTANARLNITGTKFDVLAGGDKTELTLLKGSVRFSALDHPEQAVSVTAGHASTVAGRGAPSTPSAVDAVTTTAWARDTALSHALAQAERDANVDLSAMCQGFWRQSEPPDVDTLDYATWRDGHGRFSHALTFPGATPKGQTVEADWIDLLMISGNIWQFHYDPRLPSGQPLTKIEPAAVARLARYYGVDEREMLRMMGLPESALSAASPASGQAPGRRYAQALRRWHEALMTTGQEPETSGDFKLFSLCAGQYLAETRTAAYLWVRNHPQEARQLLADSDYVAMLPAPPPPPDNGTPDEKEWIKQLREQATAARNCAPAAMEWLLVPTSTGCAPQATDQQRKLAAMVAELTPSLPKSAVGRRAGDDD